MKFTIEWLKQHLDTDLNDKEIINNLTNVGLEVESFENAPSELDDFIVAKIVNAKWITVVPGHLDLRQNIAYQTSNVVEVTLKTFCHLPAI